MGTPSIPREFIQQLLSRIEIVDLIRAKVPLRKKSSNNYFACCPFHNEKSPSFSVCQNKQFYYCFGCGAHGSAIDFLMEFERLSFPEAIYHLANQAGLSVPETASPKTVHYEHLYRLLLKITQFYQKELKQSERAIHYLKTRQVQGAVAKQFLLGFAPPGWHHLLTELGKTEAEDLLKIGVLIKNKTGNYYDRFRDRIIFPIQDRRGRVIGFGGRIIEQGEPKYLNSPETLLFQKGQELYGLYQVLETHRKLSRVVIVEGYMDVIALFQHGISYAVGTLGTATTTHHLQLLSRYTPEIIFCFDGDAAGRKAAWRALVVALPVMQDNLQIKFMFLPENEDPDSLIRKENKIGFEKRIQDALTFSQYFFQNLILEVDLTTIDGRARLVNLATEHLKQLPSGVFQQMMFEELAKKTRFDSTQVMPAKTTIPITSKKLKARPPSALRLAITLLVQAPCLAFEITEPLIKVNLTGFSLLVQLIDTIKTHSISSTGMLLEYWREEKEYKTLRKLAQIEHMIPPSGMTTEFLGAIHRLKIMAEKQIIEFLLTKAALNQLTSDEKKILNTLINKKIPQETL